ncbi:hypothetical protein J5O04_02855 [Corynebacterium hindlerae]|uniref:hypothetical protein n=1 Tax=Corynebacterium hindlerae TaxID=699041 RepID=UPI001AD7D7EB|nr:hypothetical protein [Corynebacterium hindlerae]QTH60090.1 hypothetical protein J5O04_02855 [Corynebacterium hindlerae]
MDFEALADQLKAEIDEVLFYTDLTPFLKEKTVMERMAIPRTTVHRLTINGIVDVPLEDCDYEELEAVRLFCDKRMAELDKMAKSIA